MFQLRVLIPIPNLQEGAAQAAVNRGAAKGAVNIGAAPGAVNRGAAQGAVNRGVDFAFVFKVLQRLLAISSHDLNCLVRVSLGYFVLGPAYDY